ncbi:SDR family oxidoreductase [Bacillus mangrovi]|uniref:SDR family oxidoreductase n=1 Tax=Metabacillus mangrovi TaxID=1491830 RepID=A0A7X2V586_9BACI|nr:SDR family oxidoreductase [Metabacillus mangrovi]MTH53941.1 SDR family oxidoreductase [Metabacillus mangrovi]
MQNKVVIITGATSGIGNEAARMFAEKGAHVYALGRDEESAKELEAGDLKGTIEFCKVDVDQEDSVKEFYEKLGSEKQEFHVLFNNAGIGHPAVGPLSQVDEDDWEKVMDTNLKSQYLMIKHGEQYFSKEEPVSIINNAAVVGSAAFPPALPAFSASKAGVIGMTKTLASRFAKRNVRINAISPGPVDTRLLKSLYPNEEAYSKAENEHPRGKFGSPEEISKAVYFLASPDSSYINGHNLVIDGGYSL